MRDGSFVDLPAIDGVVGRDGMETVGMVRIALAALLAGSRASARARASTTSPASKPAPRARAKRGAASATTAAAAAGASRAFQALAAAAPARLSAAAAPRPPQPLPDELWVTKHAPSSEAELVVQKKKVQEVAAWLERQREALGQRYASRLLVLTGEREQGRRAPAPAPPASCMPFLTSCKPPPPPPPAQTTPLPPSRAGPPGSGKSALLQVLGAAAGFELVEWQPPHTVAFAEAQYAVSGVGRGGA